MSPLSSWLCFFNKICSLKGRKSAFDKNIKLRFEVLPSCTIFFGAILPQEINDNIENYNISPFDTDIVWLDYKDILWVILHYEEEVKVYKERIDKLYNMINKRSD